MTQTYDSMIAYAVQDIESGDDDGRSDRMDYWAVKIADLYDREPDDVLDDIENAMAKEFENWLDNR